VLRQAGFVRFEIDAHRAIFEGRSTEDLRRLSWAAARPVDILAEAGVDPDDPAFWRGGFDVIRGPLDELESTPAGS
jgi:oligoendopeptidase F